MARTINALDLFNHIDREFDGLLGKLVDTAKTSAEACKDWAPPMSVTESADAFEVVFDAPGMQSDAFEIEFSEGTLTVSGERPIVASDDVKWHRSERRFGAFERAIAISEDIDEETLDAEYRDGVLTIRLPKQEAVKPRKINVR